MNNYIFLQQNNYNYYINKTNIAGICTDNKKPNELSILIVGDTAPTNFSFPNQEERDKNLRDILFNDRQEIVTAPKEED